MSMMIIRMSGKDAIPVRKLTNLEGVTTSDFARIAVLEKIEDPYNLHELRAAAIADDGQRSSIDEILEEL